MLPMANLAFLYLIPSIRRFWRVAFCGSWPPPYVWSLCLYARSLYTPLPPGPSPSLPATTVVYTAYGGLGGLIWPVWVVRVYGTMGGGTGTRSTGTGTRSTGRKGSIGPGKAVLGQERLN